MANAVEASASHIRSSFRAAVNASGIFPRNGPDPSARSWSHDKGGATFGAQHTLPKLPLPSLESSCQRYLEALKALSSEEEYRASRLAVQKFLVEEGPILQAQLEEYGSQQDNYFEHFGYEAFLGDDASVVLGSNAFCSFNEDPNPRRRNQIARAASLTHAAASFSQAIRTDALPVDRVRGVPLCMNQYWWLFGVTRVPCPDGGRIRLDVDSRHIVVFCRGQIYSLDVLEEDSGHVVGIHDLQKQLESIIGDASTLRTHEASKSSLGVLTTGNQRPWAHWRNTLVHDGLKNGRNLAIIDSSLFALCLDDSSPESRPDICKNMICGTNVLENGVQAGTCLNRWYDKLSIIVCRNGAAGMNFEHTCTDGSVDIGMACEIYERSISQQEDVSNGVNNSPTTGLGDDQSKRDGKVRKLEWAISKEVSAAMQDTGRVLEDRIEQHQLATLDFYGYGKNFIKSKSFPPDAFFQMALQAAYFRAYGRVRSGFEPVHTRQYLHGRTDVVRTTTTSAAAFARAFSDDNAGIPEKIETLRRATEAHVALSKDCAKGLSHHRHLGVLQKMWKGRQAFLEVAGLKRVTPDGEEGPTIFTDPGWSRLGTNILTGSNVDNPFIAYAGFGPLADDGFTVTYYIREDHMAMSVTSKNGQAVHFANTIEETLHKIKKMLDSI